MATSRSSVPLHALELGEVRVDDRRQRHLPQLDLLAEDEVQQQVERPLVDGGADLVRHENPRLPEALSAIVTSRRGTKAVDETGSVTPRAARLLGDPAHR